MIGVNSSLQFYQNQMEMQTKNTQKVKRYQPLFQNNTILLILLLLVSSILAGTLTSLPQGQRTARLWL